VARLDDDEVRRLLDARNHAVVSTVNEDGSVHSTVVWLNVEDGKIALNSAEGRKWPTNLQRDPRVTVVVYDESNPYDYVEIRGTVQATYDGADAHIDRLAQKYAGVDTYPAHEPGVARVKFTVDPVVVRHRAG
jgi:PPOX class probable F420-dependent enzyme